MLARLQKLLDEKGVKYTTILHSPAYTAQHLAAETHIHGWEIAKSTILKADGSYVMAVLPAPYCVDLERMQSVLTADSVELATEEEIRGLFPETEVGAMPPFGNLFDLPVFVEQRLAEDLYITFNAGTHREALRLQFTDYRRLVEPTVAGFGVLESEMRRPRS